MIILLDENGQRLKFSIELYCTACSSTITNSFLTISGHYGNYPIKNSARVGVYNFNITGTLEAKDVADVEIKRSEIIEMLYNKRLLFFRDKEDIRCHKCLLNGSVNVTFHAGYSINRVFTISFTLTCYDGVAWSKNEFTKELKIGKNDIEYSGRVAITPLIKIESEGTDIQIQKDFMTPFIKCEYDDKDERALFFDKDIGTINNFIIENGIVYANKSLIKDVRNESLLNPIILKNGHNYITVENHFIPKDANVKLKIIYRECFY